MIEVRPLEEGALTPLVDLTKAMHGEAPQYRDYPFEPFKLFDWGRLCLTDPNWLCLLAWEGETPIGFIAVGCVEMIFNRETTVDDLGLYVIPEKRGSTAALRLVRAMEAWATKTGSRTIRLGITTGVEAERSAKFLARLGYEQTGLMLTKRLN